MFPAAHKATNGVMVQYVDMGVEYTHNGHTMSFLGEQEDGEVTVDETLHAYYEQDGDGSVELVDDDGARIALLDTSEEAYEVYALQVLSKL
jgi:hypothetical protein